MKYSKKVVNIRSDNGTEFKNHVLESFCNEKGISQNFSSPTTPEQNGVVERKNKTLIDAARTMLNGSPLSTTYWAEGVNTACHSQNKSIYVKRHKKIAYEILKKKKPDVSYFHVFGCPIYVLKDSSQLGNFDAKADGGYFVGYGLDKKAFRVYNLRTHKVHESMHVTFDESTSTISSNTSQPPQTPSEPPFNIL